MLPSSDQEINLCDCTSHAACPHSACIQSIQPLASSLDPPQQFPFHRPRDFTQLADAECCRTPEERSSACRDDKGERAGFRQESCGGPVGEQKMQARPANGGEHGTG